MTLASGDFVFLYFFLQYVMIDFGKLHIMLVCLPTHTAPSTFLVGYSSCRSMCASLQLCLHIYTQQQTQVI